MKAWIAFTCTFFLGATLAASAQAQGIALNGVGAINRSMSGAGTAAPLDAMGSLHWNPGSILGLPSSEVSFGMELLLPTEHLSSTGVLGAGRDGGEPGVSPIPTVGWVQKLDGTPFAFGLGMYGIGGFKVNYPQSATNPILLGQPLGVGPLFASAEFQQIAPTLAMQLDDCWAVGFAPTLTLAQIQVDPFLLGAPDPLLGYTTGTHTRYHFGGGAQVGLYYTGGCGWNAGLCVKSPQWFEKLHYHSAGIAPRDFSVDMEFPMIVSLGLSYTAIPCWTFAADVRYFDYKNADLFGSPATIDATGAITGLGWDSVFAVSAGAQYQVNECLSVRAGYAFQDNPIDSATAFFNIASPLIIEHFISFGASYSLTPNVLFSAAYVHGFENSVTGPTPFAPLINTVTSEVSGDALDFSVTIRY